MCHIWDQGWTTLLTTITDNYLRPAFPCLCITASVQSFKNYIYLNNKQINSSIHCKEMRSKDKVRFCPLLFLSQWPGYKEGLKMTSPRTNAGRGGLWGSFAASHPAQTTLFSAADLCSALLSLWPPPTGKRNKAMEAASPQAITLKILNWFLTNSEDIFKNRVFWLLLKTGKYGSELHYTNIHPHHSHTMRQCVNFCNYVHLHFFFFLMVEFRYP